MKTIVICAECGVFTREETMSCENCHANLNADSTLNRILATVSDEDFEQLEDRQLLSEEE